MRGPPTEPKAAVASSTADVPERENAENRPMSWRFFHFPDSWWHFATKTETVMITRLPNTPTGEALLKRSSTPVRKLTPEEVSAKLGGGVIIFDPYACISPPGKKPLPKPKVSSLPERTKAKKKGGGK